MVSGLGGVENWDPLQVPDTIHSHCSECLGVEGFANSQDMDIPVLTVMWTYACKGACK